MSALFIELSHGYDSRFTRRITFEGNFSPGSKFILDQLAEIDDNILAKPLSHLGKNDIRKLNYVALLFIDQYEDIPKIFNQLGKPFDRTKREEIFIIGGHGLHAPAPLEYFFDVIVCGDAEDTIREIHATLNQEKPKCLLLNELNEKNIVGIYMPGVSRNYPVKHFNYNLSINRPQQQYHNSIYFELNRGCRHKCFFCEYGWTHVFRQRKEQDFWEFIAAHEKQNINFLGGDTLGACSSEMQMKLCELGHYFSGRLDTVISNQKIKHIRFGIEGVSQWHRELLGKKVITEKYLEDQMTLRSEKTDHYRFFMIANIYGTKEKEIELFYNFLINLKLKQRCYIELSWTNLTPIPGTPLENYPISEELCDDKELISYAKKPLRFNDKIIITRTPATNYPSLRNTIFYRLDGNGHKVLLALYKNRRFQSDFRKYPRWKLLKLIVEHYGYNWHDLTFGGKILGWQPVNPFEKQKEMAKRKIIKIMEERNLP